MIHQPIAGREQYYSNIKQETLARLQDSKNYILSTKILRSINEPIIKYTITCRRLRRGCQKQKDIDVEQKCSIKHCFLSSWHECYKKLHFNR